MSKKIYLSPSAQPHNAYAYGNTNEQEQCNKIAAATKVVLEKCGFSVKKAPAGQSTSRSIQESNAWGADLHIPIHTNAANGKITGGTLVMLYSLEGKNVKAGDAILKELAPITPGSDYALRANSSLAELNSTKATAVYIEVEFHDTVVGAKWIVENIQNIAIAIAKGVCKYYGVPFVGEQKQNVSTNNNGLYHIQVGAFSSKDNAEAQLKALKKAGFSDAFVTNKS